jgi:hypothetical protein
MKKTNLVADLSLYAALFKDLVAWVPDLQPTAALDIEWMQLMVANRGIPFIMIDMPEACKVVDHALSSGYYDARKMPDTFGRVRSGHREFLSSLTRMVWDHKGMIYDDVDPTAVFFLRQVLNLAKKER